MPLTNDQLREEHRCFFCTKKLEKGKHNVNTCINAYKGLKWEDVRKQYLEGKSYKEIVKSSEKKESSTSSDSTPKNPSGGLGDGQKK
jgi:hypothetical protein